MRTLHGRQRSQLRGNQKFCINFMPLTCHFILLTLEGFRSQWQRGLRRGSAAARFLELWVRIPPGTWMSVLCECCVLSSRAGHAS